MFNAKHSHMPHPIKKKSIPLETGLIEIPSQQQNTFIQKKYPPHNIYLILHIPIFS